MTVLFDINGTRSEECVTVTNLLTTRIKTRLLNIFNQAAELHKHSSKFDKKSDGIDISGRDIITTLYTNLFLKCLFKLILTKNSTIEVIIPILESFENDTTGINKSIKGILEALK